MAPSVSREHIVVYALLTAPTARDRAGASTLAAFVYPTYRFLVRSGYGVRRAVLGPISDAIGRKRVLAMGLGVYEIGTLVALFASSLEGVIARRILQGVG